MIPGDGIGPEISASVKEIFSAAGVSTEIYMSSHLNSETLHIVSICLVSVHISGIIESITTLRKGHGNPIRVSIICNPRRGLPSRGCCKFWARGWDSHVPSATW